jgi:hypothetical protein
MENSDEKPVAALSLGAAVVAAYATSTVAGDARATRMQQTGSYGVD